MRNVFKSYPKVVHWHDEGELCNDKCFEKQSRFAWPDRLLFLGFGVAVFVLIL